MLKVNNITFIGLFAAVVVFSGLYSMVKTYQESQREDADVEEFLVFLDWWKKCV